MYIHFFNCLHAIKKSRNMLQKEKSPAKRGKKHDEDYVATTRVKGQKPKKRYSIAMRIKEIFKKWLIRNDLLTAYDLRCKLIMNRLICFKSIH